MSEDTYSSDPVNNAIYGGIKADIEFCWEHERYRAVMLLLYSGIDAMATLAMPAGQVEVKGQDFIAWCDRYLQLPDGTVGGNEWYGARCGMLHNYGSESRGSRQGSSRQIIFGERMSPAVKFVPHVSQSVVMVSLEAFKDSFFAGLDKFMVDIHTEIDPSRRTLLDERLNKIFCQLPANPADR